MNCLVSKDSYHLHNDQSKRIDHSHFIDDNRLIIDNRSIIGDWPKYLFHSSFQFWRGTIQVSRSILRHRGFLPLARYLILSRFISLYSHHQRLNYNSREYKPLSSVTDYNGCTFRSI